MNLAVSKLITGKNILHQCLFPQKWISIFYLIWKPKSRKAVESKFIFLSWFSRYWNQDQVQCFNFHFLIACQTRRRTYNNLLKTLKRHLSFSENWKKYKNMPNKCRNEIRNSSLASTTERYFVFAPTNSKIPNQCFLFFFFSFLLFSSTRQC